VACRIPNFVHIAAVERLYKLLVPLYHGLAHDGFRERIHIVV
jgi:hypothetical protein